MGDDPTYYPGAASALKVRSSSTVYGRTHRTLAGEIADSYTMVIGDANAAMRVHDRMPANLGTDVDRQWLEPGPLPAELLMPHRPRRCRLGE